MGHAGCANLAITTVVSGTKTLTTTAAEVTAPFSTSLSLRVTATPSNIPINKVNGARGLGLGAGAVATVFVSAVAGVMFVL